MTHEVRRLAPPKPDGRGGIAWSPDPDCQNAVVYFILDNTELVAALGLNVERWEVWR